MQVLYFANNWTGWQIARCLRERGEEIVALVLHPAATRTHGDDIIRSVDVGAERIFDGAALRRREVVDAIKDLKPDIGISVFFGYILDPELLGVPPHGCLNVHPGLLPYNRGTYPNVWSIVEGTPAGATIHYMDAGVDTGDVVAQREVAVTPLDTGQTLYRKLERACVELFSETWPLVRAGRVARVPQRPGVGTSHRPRDVEAIDEIELDRSYTARELIDRIRARTFPPYRGVYVRQGDRRVYLRLQLLDEHEVDRADDESLRRNQ